MRLEYFEMIDQIDELASNEIRCLCSIPGESPVFEGHFPGHPILPGVLVTELMAQASGYLIMYRSKLKKMAYLSGIERARFRTLVRPNNLVTVIAKEVHEGSGYSVFDCSASVDQKRVANAEIRLRLIDFPNAELTDCMRARMEKSGLDI